MINLKKFDIKSFFKEVDEIFDEFKQEQMPSECYGWRSWRIERSFAKNSNGSLKHLHGEKGRDFKDIENCFYEFKQVKNAFKYIETPEITTKNFYKNCLGVPKKSFDYLIVFDAERKAIGIYKWEHVEKKMKINDAKITVKLNLSETVQFFSYYDEIFENTTSLSWREIEGDK
jgi:hypothetical protein